MSLDCGYLRIPGTVELESKDNRKGGSLLEEQQEARQGSEMQVHCDLHSSLSTSVKESLWPLSLDRTTNEVCRPGSVCVSQRNSALSVKRFSQNSSSGDDVIFHDLNPMFPSCELQVNKGGNVSSAWQSMAVVETTTAHHNTLHLGSYWCSL